MPVTTDTAPKWSSFEILGIRARARKSWPLSQTIFRTGPTRGATVVLLSRTVLNYSERVKSATWGKNCVDGSRGTRGSRAYFYRSLPHFSLMGPPCSRNKNPRDTRITRNLVSCPRKMRHGLSTGFDWRPRFRRRDAPPLDLVVVPGTKVFNLDSNLAKCGARPRQNLRN